MTLLAIRATVNSIHFRTHDAVMSPREPANATGANKAETISSSFLVISAAHTITDAITTTRASRSITAGESVPSALMAVTCWPRFAQVDDPVPATMMPLAMLSAASNKSSVMPTAAPPARKATNRPRTARPMPPMSLRAALAITWTKNRPVPTTRARPTVMPRSVAQPGPPS